jgi:hypothetical protein
MKPLQAISRLKLKPSDDRDQRKVMHAKPSGISHVEQGQDDVPSPSPLMRREAEEEERWAGTGTQQRESRATRLRFVFCYLRYTLAKRVVI